MSPTTSAPTTRSSRCGSIPTPTSVPRASRPTSASTSSAGPLRPRTPSTGASGSSCATTARCVRRSPTRSAGSAARSGSASPPGTPSGKSCPRMRTSRAEPALFALLWLLGGGTAGAAEPRNVKVALQFESRSSNRVTATDPAGRVIATGRGVRGRGRLTVEDSRTRVRQTTSLFVVAQDGGEGRLLVATAVPYPQVAFFYDYAT